MQAAEISNSITTTQTKADPYANKQSLEFSFRQRRFEQIQSLIQAIMDKKGSCEILDLGGTETYWLIGEDFIQRNRNSIHFTLVNTENHEIRQRDLFSFVVASATDPNLFADRRFDLVHSNSVIEHVGTWADMNMFAANTRRLGANYYVQTPNYWFPYEPHFRFPGFQYLPRRVRIALIQRYSLGFFRRIANYAEAQDIIDHHCLLSTRQMEMLFCDGKVTHEKWMGSRKSIIAIRDESLRQG